MPKKKSQEIQLPQWLQYQHSVEQTDWKPEQWEPNQESIDGQAENFEITKLKIMVKEKMKNRTQSSLKIIKMIQSLGRNNHPSTYQ